MEWIAAISSNWNCKVSTLSLKAALECAPSSILSPDSYELGEINAAWSSFTPSFSLLWYEARSDCVKLKFSWWLCAVKFKFKFYIEDCWSSFFCHLYQYMMRHDQCVFNMLRMSSAIYLICNHALLALREMRELFWCCDFLKRYCGWMILYCDWYIMLVETAMWILIYAERGVLIQGEWTCCVFGAFWIYETEPVELPTKSSEPI